ncbi:MAG TPA: hypothetical protein VF134_04960 [Candidatus Dormibacteraeota bacterium]
MTWNPVSRLRSVLILGSLVTAAALAVVTALPVSASGDYMSGHGGSDVSWPQCGRAVDITPDSFSIVGVNNGRPFTMNPCFAGQYAWSKGGHAAPASVYINLEYGETSDGYNRCAAADHGCAAYDFGFLTAQYAYTVANYTSHGDSLHASTWWLDVETDNVWNDNTGLNAQVIRGALEYLRSTGHKMGVYSTPHMWGVIAGGYNPGPSVGNWIAGADSTDDYSQCFNPLWPGGQVWVFQYLNYDIDLDQNHAC